MRIGKRHASEFLADELTIAVMSKAIRNVDLDDASARNVAYREAGIPVEKTCGLDDDAVHVARIYRDRIARPRAAREAMCCVFAAALFLPGIANAAPIFTAEGTAAVATALYGLSWLWSIFTHSLAACFGALIMAFFVAGGRADRDNAGTLE